MTVLEYLQSLDLETRVAVVGCADNALRGIRNLDEQTAAAASFGLFDSSESSNSARSMSPGRNKRPRDCNQLL